MNAIIIARRGRAAKGKNAGLYGKNDNKKAKHNHYQHDPITNFFLMVSTLNKELATREALRAAARKRKKKNEDIQP